MPWRQGPKKGVDDCDKLRGAVIRRYIRRYPNGETRLGETQAPPAEHIGGREGTEGTETS
jgi:hypothetical protein